MANLTIGNNPNSATPATYDEEGNELTPEIPAEPSPSIRIVDEEGAVKIIHPGQSVGLPFGRYVIEVVE